MDFTSFFTLFVIAAAIASIYRLFLRYRFLDGYDALLGKAIIDWFGAWFGSLVLGN